MKNLREKFGFSQEIVAGYLGVTHTVISNYETGKRQPTHEHLTKLADLYDVDIVDLFSNEPAIYSTNAAFAFRAETVKPEDLTSIALFRRIVKNYLTLQKID